MIVVLTLLHLVLISVLLFPLLTVVLAGMRKEEIMPSAEGETDFACIITAYQQVDIALPLVDSLLKQKHQRHHVYLVADACDVEGISFDEERVTLLRPPKKLGSKVRSIQHAIQHFTRSHDYIVIFDPDNLAPSNFLGELNTYTQAGYLAVQGVRAAKNLDTLYACLDATGELYYNYSVRYVPWRMGASSTISGSGMAIEANLFKSYLKIDLMDTEKHEVIVAEDKILQIDLLRRNTRIAYAKKAILYDEKVTSGYQIERQRTRWINSYFQHLPSALGLVWRGLSRFNYNQFIFGLFIAYLPMFLLVGATTSLGLIDLIGYGISGNVAFLKLFIAIGSAGILFIINFLWVLKIAGAPKEIWRSLWGIPAFILRQVKALFKIRQSNKDFLVTTHSKTVKIEDLE